MNVIMRWARGDECLEIWGTLSRRNLRTLLFKLADPESKRTIAGDVEPHVRLYVRAEADDDHYAERQPRSMTLWAEASLQARLDGAQESA